LFNQPINTPIESETVTNDKSELTIPNEESELTIILPNGLETLPKESTTSKKKCWQINMTYQTLKRYHMFVLTKLIITIET
jgi:hypothetical protein